MDPGTWRPWQIRRWPVRWKLTAVSASLTFAILLIFGGVVGHIATQRVRGDFNHDLASAVSRLVSRTRIVVRPFGEPIVYSPDLADVSLPNGAIARVLDSEGLVLDESPEESPSLGLPHVGISSVRSFTVATQPVFGANSEVVGYIQYARRANHVDSTVTEMWLLIAGGVFGGTALAILAGGALARRAMRPVANLTAAAREITATGDPSTKLPVPITEDEVAELNETLQEMLTALDASQTEREAAMQKQREFVADASHELRTPLTSVLANLELLEAELENTGRDEDKEIITSAVRSSKRMSRLVSDLLVLAKSDAGQHRPKVDEDLAEITRSACREMEPNLGGRTLKASLRPAPIHGNQDELHRMLTNLLDNARRYSPNDATISVSTDTDRGTTVLKVADSGPGVPEEMRERVFERFVRGAPGADTNQTDGTGLGLAMVQAIAHAHGGRVVAGRSAELGGAEFIATFTNGDGRTETPQSPGAPARPGRRNRGQ
jgi:two-component system OmpR family sensor kinase